ncbi:MAG: NAD-dependent epimerase/dehydratase family protein [Chthoniobacterales bacterium]
MKYLITGAKGYVGGRLVDFLEKRNHEIIAVSRTPPTNELRKRVSWCTPDDLLRDEFKSDSQSIENFVHLAAPNEIVASKNPKEAMRGTIEPTLDLLDLAESCDCKRFIYFSTAHVYGAPLQGYLEETTQAKPAHPYSIAHRCAEDFVLAAARNAGFKSVVLRLSNSLGAPTGRNVERWSLIANDLCRQAATSDSLVLKTTGTQLRDFIALRDVCAAVEFFSTISELFQAEIYNLGSGKSVSILQIANWVADSKKNLTGKRPEIILGDIDPPNFELEFSIQKLKQLGFTPSGSLQMEIQETLEKCLKWFS